MNLYQQDPYLKELTTTVKFAFEEDGKAFLELEETLFHPQGGGQKSDKGTLLIGGQELALIKSVKDPNASSGVVLEIAWDGGDLVALKGQTALCKIDWDFRYGQMRLHSAAHLHHCMLEKAADHSLATPKSSTIEDGFVLNRYEGDAVTLELVEQANALLRDAVAQGADAVMSDDPAHAGVSWWACLGFKIPCGGTHVKNIAELGALEVDFAMKKKMPSVRIKLT